MQAIETEIKNTINTALRYYRNYVAPDSRVPARIKWEYQDKFGTVKVTLLGGNNFRPAIAEYEGPHGYYYAKVRESFAEVIGKPYPIGNTK